MIAFTLLVVEPSGRRDSILFVNAAEGPFVTSGSRGRSMLADPDALVAVVEGESEGEFSRLVSNEEVLANEAQLQASRYVLPVSARELQAKLEGAATVELGEVVETARPMAVTKDQSGIEAGEIGAADIPAHGYTSAYHERGW